MPAFHLLDDIVVPYMRDSSQERSITTQQRESCHERKLRQHFGSYYLCDQAVKNVKTVTGAVIKQYQEKRIMIDGVSPVTVQSELALASVAINYAIAEWSYDLVNPFQKRLISKKHRQAIRPRQWYRLSKSDEKRLLLAATPIARDIIEFALHTGMRQREILELQWDQIEGDRITFTPEQQKANRHSVVRPNSVARAIIKHQKVMSEYVFHDEEGKRIDRHRFRVWWDKARKAAGLTLQFRDLRNNSGQRVLEATGELTKVKYHLRHSEVRTTERCYVVDPEEMMADAAEQIVGM